MPHVPGRRGAFGDWLKTEREKRYRTQADALADYRRLAGLVIASSEYAQWESGSRVPKDDNPKRIALYAFYGSREDAPSDTPADPVVAAIDRLGKDIRDLTTALRGAFAALDARSQERALAVADTLAQIEDELERERSARESQRRPGMPRSEDAPQPSAGTK